MDDHPADKLAPKGASDIEMSAGEEFDRIQEALLQESAEVVYSALQFHSVPLEDAEGNPYRGVPDKLPDSWMPGREEEYRRRAFAIALMARSPSSDAPMGLKLAFDVYKGIVASRGQPVDPGANTGFTVTLMQSEQLPTKTINAKDDD